MKFLKYPDRAIRHIVSIPFIWGTLIPIVILDITIEIYHHVCFRLYKIPRVSRREYIHIDRHRLSYLNPIEKINCMYCGYANGLFYYITRIANLSEAYWCGIKHEKALLRKKQIHQHHLKYMEYDDEQAYKELKYGNKS